MCRGACLVMLFGLGADGSTPCPALAYRPTPLCQAATLACMGSVWWPLPCCKWLPHPTHPPFAVRRWCAERHCADADGLHSCLLTACQLKLPLVGMHCAPVTLVRMASTVRSNSIWLNSCCCCRRCRAPEKAATSLWGSKSWRLAAPGGCCSTRTALPMNRMLSAMGTETWGGKAATETCKIEQTPDSLRAKIQENGALCTGYRDLGRLG